MSDPKIKFVSASVVVRMADGLERSIELQDDPREQLTADVSVSTNEVDVSEFGRGIGNARVVMAFGQVATIHLRGSVVSHVTEQAAPAPWRFDVPEIPPGVAAVEDRLGWIWGREGAAWQALRAPAPVGAYRLYEPELFARAPLVECEDPRAAS